CEACIAVCPVDCIVKCYPPGDRSGLMSWCEIDTDRCIACRWCIRLPRKRGEFPLLVCPWEAISMVPRDSLEASSGTAKSGAAPGAANSDVG
ncbi:MAG: electron transporter RnfB, partial [Planctomycetota bacterium]